jgi:hypothetical protein
MTTTGAFGLPLEWGSDLIGSLAEATGPLLELETETMLSPIPTTAIRTPTKEAMTTMVDTGMDPPAAVLTARFFLVVCVWGGRGFFVF